MDTLTNSSAANAQAQNTSDFTALIRAAWESTLGHDKFDNDTSFFDAGGDSFVLISLVAELAKSSGLTVKAAHVLRAPTIAKQAAALNKLKDAQAAAPALSAEPV